MTDFSLVLTMILSIRSIRWIIKETEISRIRVMTELIRLELLCLLVMAEEMSF